MLLLILIVLLLFVPQFLLQRRQKKQVQELKQLQDNLAIGQRVMTTAGLHAVVRGIEETTVDLEIAPGVVSTWEKFAVLRNLSEEAEAASKQQAAYPGEHSPVEADPKDTAEAS